MAPFVPLFARRPFGGGRQTFVYNNVINLGSYGGNNCGGHVHHCHGGGGMSKGMQFAWGLGIFTSVLQGLFGKGGTSTQALQQQNYNIGYNAGLYTPGGYSQYTPYGSGGYNAGFNQGLYSSGMYNQQNPYALSGNNSYGQQQTVLAAKGNELVSMVKDLANDYGFIFGENEEIPQLTADGQNYTYKGKTFATVTDLRNYIEHQEGLGCEPSRLPQGTQQDIVDENPIDARTLPQPKVTPTEDDEVATPPVATTPTPAPAEETTTTPPTATTPAPAPSEETTTPPTASTPTQPTQTPAPKTPLPGQEEEVDDPTTVTQNETKVMMAKLRGMFGEKPEGVTINGDGTYNYTVTVKHGDKVTTKHYENLNLNGLKYLIESQKRYSSASADFDGPESYDNKYNSNEGRMYNNGSISITKQQVSNTETFAAFMIKNNEYTSVELGKISKSDFEKTFKNMFEDNVKNAKTSMTETEFIKYHEDYERNAKHGDIRRDPERQKTNTVDLSDSDKEHLKALFRAMSNGSEKLTMEQYTNFMTTLFKEHKGKITRSDLDKFSAKWISKNTKDPKVELKYDYGNKRINSAMDSIRNAFRVFNENGDDSYTARAKRDKIIEDAYNQATAEEKKLIEKYFKEEFGSEIKDYKNNWFTKNIWLPAQ